MCCPWTSSLSIPWELVKHADSWPHPDPLNLKLEEGLGGGVMCGEAAVCVGISPWEHADACKNYFSQSWDPPLTRPAYLDKSWKRTMGKNRSHVHALLSLLMNTAKIMNRLMWPCYDSQPLRWNRQCDISNNSLIWGRYWIQPVVKLKWQSFL